MLGACTYLFREGIDMKDVEDTLLLAVMAAEGIFGEASVRENHRVSEDRDARAIAVDASTPVGQVVNLIFASYIAKEFGPENFAMHRLTVVLQ